MLLISLLLLLQSTCRTSLLIESGIGFGCAAKTLAGRLTAPNDKRSVRKVRQFQIREYCLTVTCDDDVICTVASLSSVEIRIMTRQQESKSIASRKNPGDLPTQVCWHSAGAYLMGNARRLAGLLDAVNVN